MRQSRLMSLVEAVAKVLVAYGMICLYAPYRAIR